MTGFVVNLLIIPRTARTVCGQSDWVVFAGSILATHPPQIVLVLFVVVTNDVRSCPADTCVQAGTWRAYPTSTCTHPPAAQLLRANDAIVPLSLVVRVTIPVLASRIRTPHKPAEQQHTCYHSSVVGVVQFKYSRARHAGTRSVLSVCAPAVPLVVVRLSDDCTSHAASRSIAVPHRAAEQKGIQRETRKL